MSDQTPVSQRELDRNVRENERLEKKMKGIQVSRLRLIESMFLRV